MRSLHPVDLRAAIAMTSRRIGSSRSPLPDDPSRETPTSGPAAQPSVRPRRVPVSAMLSRLRQMQRERDDAARTLPSAPSEPLPSLPLPPADLRLHEAVTHADPQAARELVDAGMRPTQLDAERRTPLDLLAAMSLDAPARQAIHAALLHSQNPSAPRGYLKPEAFHGSPWGFEILLSGELRGGVNDSKGGSQSLEGQVFFSDRTPAHPADATTRANLRSHARVYADGIGLRTTTASGRGFQYRMAQAILDGAARGVPLALRAAPDPSPIEVTNDAELPAQMVEDLAQRLQRSGTFRTPQFAQASLAGMLDGVRLPAALTVKVGQAAPRVIEGQALRDLYTRAAHALKQRLEGGKAPFLALINSGRVVPIVFGFEKVSGLQSHTIHYTPPVPSKDHSYQSENHPLAGSARGGRLKEIEVRDLADLATLTLACLARGAQIPEHAVIRLKSRGPDAAQARYLSADERERFEAALARAVCAHAGAPDEAAQAVAGAASIEQLQTINDHLRALPLAELLAD